MRRRHRHVGRGDLGEGGLIEGVQPGAVVVDCCTVSVSYAATGRRDPRQTRASSFLDAPVTGSTPGAEGGNLTFMVGGDQAVFEKVKPLLEPMGKRLYYCGAPAWDCRPS